MCILLLCSFRLINFVADVDEDSDYEKMKNRDKKRWDLADGDHDNKLTKQEFSDFLHPEESEHMRPTVVDVSPSLLSHLIHMFSNIMCHYASQTIAVKQLIVRYSMIGLLYHLLTSLLLKSHI